MLHRRAVICLPAALALGGRAWAQDTAKSPSTDLPGQVSKAAVAPVRPSAGRMLKQKMQAWIAESDFEDRNDLTVLQGRSIVSVPPTNPDWVRLRMLAYEDAVLDAQAQYASLQGVEIRSETIKGLLKGADSPPPYTDTRSPDQAAEIVRKALAVAGGTLDQNLKDQGIDPKKYEQLPEPQKTILLRDYLKIQVGRRAFARLVGVLPVQSFEAQDGAGTYEIGVVMIASPLIQDFAEQVTKARGEFSPDPARAQDLTTLYSDQDQLLQDFGIRRLFDKQGLPVIVSFAQWGSGYRGTDPVFAAKYEEAAEAQAEALADGQLADFLAGNVDSSNDTTVGQQVDRIALSMPDGETKVEEAKKVIDEQRKLIKRVANVRLVGVRTLYSWTGKHPDSETPIIGVIRIWSAASEKGVRAQQEKPARGAAAPETPPSQINRTPSVVQGRSLMKSTDF